jgi:hypothetical protein
MKRALITVVILVAALVVLLVLGLSGAGRSSGTVGVAAGSALPGFSGNASTPEQALSNFLLEVQRRHWDRAFASIERTKSNPDPGSLRSGLDRIEWRPAFILKPGKIRGAAAARHRF